MKLELESTWHALEIPTEARINFLKALRSSFPQNMQQYKTIFGISGADACETAVSRRIEAMKRLNIIKNNIAIIDYKILGLDFYT